jgi:hypothetical protein
MDQCQWQTNGPQNANAVRVQRSPFPVAPATDHSAFKLMYSHYFLLPTSIFFSCRNLCLSVMTFIFCNLWPSVFLIQYLSKHANFDSLLCTDRYKLPCNILIMKANEMHHFSDLFDKVLYMFRTCPLSINRSISTLYTRNRYLSC